MAAMTAPNAFQSGFSLHSSWHDQSMSDRSARSDSSHSSTSDNYHADGQLRALQRRKFSLGSVSLFGERQGKLEPRVLVDGGRPALRVDTSPKSSRLPLASTSPMLRSAPVMRPHNDLCMLWSDVPDLPSMSARPRVASPIISSAQSHFPPQLSGCGQYSQECYPVFMRESPLSPRTSPIHAQSALHSITPPSIVLDQSVLSPWTPPEPQVQSPQTAQNKEAHKHQRQQQLEWEANQRYSNVNLTIEAVYPMCKDQLGCRYLQQVLDKNDAASRELIFNGLLPHFAEVMSDPFGNYLAQKLAQNCSPGQRAKLIRSAAPHLIKVAMNAHGTRSLQRLIERLTSPSEMQSVVMALEEGLVTLSTDHNGNHVVQKLLARFGAPFNQCIYDAVASHCIILGTHRHGCCVLQRCIDFATPPQKTQLVNAIVAYAHSLVQDPFGNYVVQYVLDLGNQAFTEAIGRRLLGELAFLSCQKFSSNVIEKASEELRYDIVQELCHPANLAPLMSDSYGNYVIQTAIDVADRNQALLMMQLMWPILTSVPYTGTAATKRITNKISQVCFRHQLTPEERSLLMHQGRI